MVTPDRRHFCLLIAGLLAGDLFAQCQLSGLVESQDVPLENAVVVISRAGTEIAREITQADGRFSLTYASFPSTLQAAAVTVKAQGYVTDIRQFFRGNDACLQITNHEVVLESEQSGAPSSGSSTGYTIFIVPYTLYGQGSETIAERFNQDLPGIVHHRILAYKTLLNVSTVQVDISVENVDSQIVDPPVTAAQGERIRRLGFQLNALAVIAGDGDVMPAANGDDQIEITSVFRTIPAYGNQAIMMQPISDQLPASQASPGRIAGQMQDLWGKQAMLSYVLQRLATHQGEWQKAELESLAGLLIEVRNTMTGDDRLLQPLQGLLTALEAEIGP